MKNLIKSISLIFLMSLSLFGYSQKNDTISTTTGELVENNPSIITLSCATGDSIVVISGISGEYAFTSDTTYNTVTDSFTTVSVSSIGQLISKYKVKKQSDNVLIKENINELILTINITDTTTKSDAGINQISYNKINVSIFPNPTNMDFTVKSDTKIEKLDVINMTGQIVQSVNLDSDVMEYKMSVSNLPNGIYFVRINDLTTQKLIVNK